MEQLWRKAEGTGIVQPREEKALGDLSILQGPTKAWRETISRGLEWQNKEGWLQTEKGEI